MNSLLDNYIYSGNGNFPINECVNPIKEEGVFESPKYYECIIIDIHYPEDGYIIRIMRPYIWRDNNEEQILYGWISDNGYFLDNIERPIHNDDKVVIGFRPVNKDMFEDGIDKMIKQVKSNQIWE